jgi:hypothetical protein
VRGELIKEGQSMGEVMMSGGRKIPKEKLSSKSNSDFRCSGSAMTMT